MSKQPDFKHNYKGFSIAGWKNIKNDNLSLSMPKKTYNKNAKNKSEKAEWVESKYLFENEVSDMIIFLQQVQEKLKSNSTEEKIEKVEEIKEMSFDDNDIPF